MGHERGHEGRGDPIQLAGFLMALRVRGESVAEIRGLADVMLAHAHRIEVPGPTIDIVGTGGDRQNTVNISTMSAIVMAASGCAWSNTATVRPPRVLGRRMCSRRWGVDPRFARAGATGRAGGGDHLLLRQRLPPAMRHAAPARKRTQVATAFNLLGPLTNPAQPTWTAVEVADKRYAPIIAGVFASRGTDAAVFRGRDGLDELTVSDVSDLWWVRERRGLRAPDHPGGGRGPATPARRPTRWRCSAERGSRPGGALGEEGRGPAGGPAQCGCCFGGRLRRRGRDVGGDHGSHCRWGAPGGGDDRFGCGPGHPRRMGRRHRRLAGQQHRP